MPRLPSVLVYLRRGDELLLMHRHKEPNLGLWVAPGGKVELDESPHETARREMYEETGLTVEHLEFRALGTEVSPLPDWQWLLFIYVATGFSGTLKPDLREGSLAWVTPERYLAELSIPQADALFAPLVLDPAVPFFEAKFTYDADLRLVEWERYET